MNEELQAYIDNSKKAGVSAVDIRAQLVGAGWAEADVDAALGGGDAGVPAQVVPAQQPLTETTEAQPDTQGNGSVAHAFGGYDPRSGMGDASEFPEELKGLNWGAFAFTFIWGIPNKVWLSLIVFAPIVGGIWSIVLLIKGNEWAWGAKKWESVAAFKESKRKWDLAAFIFFGLYGLLILSAVVVLLISR